MEKQKGKTPSVCDWIGGGHCVVIDATNHPVSADDDNTADGTSLGADNCVGVAYILALLGSTDIPHPPLEAVLTVMEEKGKVGGANYDTTKLTGTHMIDFNWITDDQILAGCGGDLPWRSICPRRPIRRPRTTSANRSQYADSTAGTANSTSTSNAPTPSSRSHGFWRVLAVGPTSGSPNCPEECRTTSSRPTPRHRHARSPRRGDLRPRSCGHRADAQG